MKRITLFNITWFKLSKTDALLLLLFVVLLLAGLWLSSQQVMHEPALQQIR